ncbi:hypothetical protein [Paenibacillus sp. MMO-58]|uniref:hypothetical protein n=1 Tax=Paenibacillus sp. MMO-58 TaxID=3081290 RepID=UPI0030176E23
MTITIQGKTQWDAPITYASSKAFELAKQGQELKARIDGIQADIRREEKNLTLKRLADYREEILDNLEKLRTELPTVKAEFEKVFDAFNAEGGCW